jgi:hypothetical protein
MKNLLTFLVLCFALSVQAQTEKTKFQPMKFKLTDEAAYQAAYRFTERTSTPNDAIHFEVSVIPAGATITGTDATGKVTYSVALSSMILEDVQEAVGGFTTYFYCNRATENHITVWMNGDQVVRFNFLKPGGYKLSLGERK